jgi:hypothetical protein
MFFLESVYNYRSTEPVWFRFFRGFFAITLTGVVIFYLINQIKKINTEAYITIEYEKILGKKKKKKKKE